MAPNGFRRPVYLRGATVVVFVGAMVVVDDTVTINMKVKQNKWNRSMIIQIFLKQIIFLIDVAFYLNQKGLPLFHVQSFGKNELQKY